MPAFAGMTRFQLYNNGFFMKKTAIVFPGQGSQSVAMLADVAAQFPEVEKTFAEGSSVLGYDLWKLVQQGPADVLNQTVHTQPALLAASVALWRIIQSRQSIKPEILAGHSLGEYTALVCANALSFQDAIRLVAARGQYMQDAVPANIGALAAIVGLDDAVVKILCDNTVQANEVLAPANYNCPGQLVIAGHRTAVERALITAKEQGARLAMLLPVSVPSHCVLMKPAAERLAELLKTISITTPAVPVINNVDVVVYQDAAAIRDGLVRQLFMPVRWVETVQSFVKLGVTRVIECGPGKVLSGLNKRIAAELELASANDVSSLTLVME